METKNLKILLERILDTDKRILNNIKYDCDKKDITAFYSGRINALEEVLEYIK